MGAYRVAAEKTRIHSVSVTIREDVAGDDWTIEWDHKTIPDIYLHCLGCEGRKHRGICCEREPTAADAQRGVKRTLARLAELGLATTCFVNWCPTTTIGRLVVNAVVSAS